MRPILREFFKSTPSEIPVYVIGVGSNLLVRDGGVPGVVIRLGKGFGDTSGGAWIPDQNRRCGP